MLEEVDLQNSYVTGFERDERVFRIRTLFSIPASSIYFRNVKQGEFSDYRYGWIVFDATEVKWDWKLSICNIDPSGEVDFGSIDSIQEVDSGFLVNGDWGDCEVISDNIRLLIE